MNDYIGSAAMKHLDKMNKLAREIEEIRPMAIEAMFNEITSHQLHYELYKMRDEIIGEQPDWKNKEEHRAWRRRHAVYRAAMLRII